MAPSKNTVFFDKARRVVSRKADSIVGRLYPIQRTLTAMALRPFELHLELTNLCNANCVFCPYQFQTREIEFMSDEVFSKSVSEFISISVGSVCLTLIVD